MRDRHWAAAALDEMLTCIEGYAQLAGDDDPVHVHLPQMRETLAEAKALAGREQ